MDENGCLITSGHRDDLESVVGKITIAPTPYAQTMWKLMRENPRLYEFGVEYLEDTKTGKCELVGISLITRRPPLRSNKHG
jgi:hypothetical protein